ncbi:MAG: RdgB/HAM1 family non-canonical purine NTP pyrophosphatase [Leptolyngbyaceae bacterium]|nr:RdgB/HAM1 family non-canonical purine NTP pyrophosphatase [Leptolyngbyaceae bacterium]
MAEIKKLVVATGNPGKLKEMQSYLADLTDLGIQLSLKPKSLDIEETGTTFMENARLKAAQVAQAMNEWAIADDSGLEIDALNGAPGLYSARYADSDEACIDRVLREMQDAVNRTAQFVCAVAIARPDGAIALERTGICRGEILYERRGEGGFGYDPIFYVPSCQMTFAEMHASTKHEISHRGQAFHHLLPEMKALFSPES